MLSKILKYRTLVFLMAAFMLLSGGRSAGQSTAIGFRIPAVSVSEKDTFTVSIVADSVLTGREVYSYRFHLTYSTSYLEFIGFEGRGSALSSWGDPEINSSNPGTVIISGAGGSALTGSGEMLILRFVSKRYGTAYINFDTGESYLNERNPSSVYTNGTVSMAQLSYPNIYPDSRNLFVGDVVQMSVSGGEAPFTYSVENSSVAVITDQTKVQATAPGTTRIKVTDNNGEVSYTTGVFDVRAVRMDIEQVSTWPGDTFYIPVKIEVAPGTSVYSGKVEVDYDTGISGLTNVITAADYQANFQSKAETGKLLFSFATTAPVTGSGVLCYLGFRANSSGNKWVHFGDMHFNEELLAWQKSSSNYYIDINSLPVLTITPNSGKMLWGDILKVTASGGTAPYTYSVSDEEVASIDAQGNIHALSGGEVTVTAVDAHGATRTSGIFTMNDCNVTVNNTDGTLDVDTRVPITVSQLPSGRSILGFKGSFEFDATYLDYVRVDEVNSILLEGAVNGNTITVSGASGNGIKSGVIGYLVFRIKNDLALNASTDIYFSGFSANENTIYASLVSGQVTRVEQVSYRPVANAGSDFSVQEGEQAQLDGTGSYDNDGDDITYKWVAPDGITLDDATSATPHFTAPYVDDDTPYIFKLVVNDGTDDSDTSTVTVTVLQLNMPPVADAGADESYMEGSSVSLDGTGSYDPDSDPLSYSWTSLDGIVMFNSTSAKPSFILPQVTQNTPYRFKLVVNDGVVSSAPDTVIITSLQVNKKPVAFAGGDFTVNEGEAAALDGSLSYDDDGDHITYLWSAPANVTLSSLTVDKPTFTAPAVHRDSVLTFTLVVNDGKTDSDPDEVLVTVKNVDILSTEAEITGVTLTDMVSYSIDEANNTVLLTMPYGYDITSMAPVFDISDQAEISPAPGSVHDFSTPVFYDVTAEDGTTIRTWKVEIDVPERTMTRSLSAGWNWISLNVKPDDMSVTSLFSGLSLQELDYVKSTEYSATYYSSTGWFGDLESFPEKRGVKMKKATAEQFSVTGKEINPEINPISLVPGWNSIAYLLNKNVAINDAVKAASIPSGNVVMKGIDGSSVYVPGTGWAGEIDTMRILSAYKLNVENAGELKYDASGVTKNAVIKRYTRSELLAMYGIDPSQFSHSATLIAEAFDAGGNDLSETGDLLLAFSGDECRGVSEVTYVPSLGKYLYVLTYYSNSDGDDISFEIKKQDGSELTTDYSVSFKDDEITGEAGSPRPLFAGEATAVPEGVDTGINIFPNPVFSEMKLVSSGNITRVTVYDQAGVTVVDVKPSGNRVSIPAGNLPPGIYSVRIETDNGVVVKKVVKAAGR